MKPTWAAQGEPPTALNGTETAQNPKVSEATALINAGRASDAIAVLRNQPKAAVDDATAQYTLGLAYQHLARWQDAADAYGLAITRTDQATLKAQAYNNVGVCLEKSGQVDPAIVAFEHALNWQNDLSPAHLNLARLYQARQQWRRSIDQLTALHQTNNVTVETWMMLSTAYVSIGQYENAAQLYANHYDLLKAHPATLFAHLLLARRISRHSENDAQTRLIDWAQQTTSAQPSEGATASELTFAAQYYALTRAQARSVYQRLYEANKAKAAPQQNPYRRRFAGEKWRIGYLSPDFREHVMGRWMLPIIENHDRSRYDVTLISTLAQSNEDQRTRSFEAAADRFIPVSTLSDEQAAKVIAQLDLDLLIDLAGHSQGGRPFILAHHPARVVATHLGFHGCVGVDGVDYKLTDRECDPDDACESGIERPLYIKGCAYPFIRTPKAPITLTRKDYGLEDTFTFATFVPPLKLSGELIDAWVTILKRASNAVLVFSSPYADDEIAFRRIFADAGVDPHQIKTLDHQRARYDVIDAVLDTYPYSGGDTTLAALDRGVPVITRRAERHASRVTASLLKSIGCAQWIHDEWQGYIEQAINWANDAGQLKHAKAHLQQALQNPDIEVDAYTQRLEAAYDHAIQTYQQGNKVACPVTAAQFHSRFDQAIALHRDGKLSEASEAYEQLLAWQPEHAPLHYLLGKVRQQEGSPEIAMLHYQTAVQHDGQHADSWQAIGHQQANTGNHSGAYMAFKAALATRPDHPKTLSSFALSAMALNRFDEAVNALEQVVRSQPPDADHTYNLGVAYQRLGRLDEARAAYRQTLSLQARHKEALFNYGVCLREQGQNELAIKAWQRALLLDPTFEDAYLQLRPTLLAAGHIPAWLENLDRYERHVPNAARANLYSIEAAIYLGQTDKARHHLDRAIVAAMAEAHVDVAMEMLEELMYLVLFFDITAQDHLRLYKRFDELAANKYPTLPSPTRRPTGRRVKLAYLSADMKHHVMGKMILATLAHHNRDRYEVYAYNLSAIEDSLTTAIAGECDHFVRVAGQPPEVIAQRIRADDIDVLIDCATHTKGSEPGAVIMRPARCHITWVASSGALGSRAIDYKLTDEHLDLPDEARFQLEPLLTMRHCAFPYVPVPPLRPSPYHRRLLHVPKDTFIFAAFVQILKLSPRVLGVWKRILDQVPNAKIAFSPGNMSARQGYINVCQAHGIEPSRLLFIDAGKNDAENMARFDVVDAVLDTFPYGGVNGTLEAISARVPMVTLTGRRNQERTSTSIFRYLGMTDTLAPSENEYIKIAVRLATDHAFNDGIRAAIERQLTSSGFASPKLYTQAFEAAIDEGLAACETAARGR
jgi:predicted O-linked N-acetylglucosamine transferase (SPINDLY family)